MPYNKDQTWDNLVGSLQNAGRNLIRALHEAEEAERNWKNYSGAESDATIATELSRPEADIAALRAAFEALKAIKDYANNQTPTQNNYLADLRKFT